MEDKTMTELILLLEVLRFLFFVYEVIRYLKHRKREKGLFEALESYKQSLTKSEDAKKSKQLDN
jgi:hypothetical protein